MESRVKGPAIGLIITGVLGLLLALLGLGMALMNDGLAEQEYADGTNEVLKFFTSPAYTLGSSVLGFFLSGLYIFAGLKMKKLESWALSMTACVLAMIPCGGCCLVGLPFGIWGLVVLMNEDVKQAFRS